jgi:hypothetical protein
MHEAIEESVIIRTTKEKLLANGWVSDNGWDYRKETDTHTCMELNKTPSLPGEYYLYCHDVEYPEDLIAIGKELLKLGVK